jgi:hypothetical protein
MNFKFVYELVKPAICPAKCPDATGLYPPLHTSLTNKKTLIPTRLHGVTSQKPIILVLTAAITSNLIEFEKHAHSATILELLLMVFRYFESRKSYGKRLLDMKRAPNFGAQHFWVFLDF